MMVPLLLRMHRRGTHRLDDRGIYNDAWRCVCSPSSWSSANSEASVKAAASAESPTHAEAVAQRIIFLATTALAIAPSTAAAITPAAATA